MTTQNAAEATSFSEQAYSRELQLSTLTGVAIQDPACTSLVRYITIDELLRKQVVKRRRFEVFAVAAFLALGIYSTVQWSEHKTELEQTRAAEQRALAKMDGLISKEGNDLKTAVVDLRDKADNTSSRMELLEQKAQANDRMTRQLSSRLSDLESEKKRALKEDSK